MSKPVPSIEDLKVKRTPVRNVNKEHKESYTRLEKVAIYTTEKVGTMGFFFVIVLWTILWLGWNTYAPVNLRFDSFPAFAFWLFISNVLQLAFLPLIMVGQNLQGRHAEERAQNDFEINVKAEREVEAIFLHLEQQGESIQKILSYIEHKNNN